MKRIAAGILLLILLLTLGACSDQASGAAATDERAAANITAGAAKVAQDGNYIYVSRGDRIIRFKPDEATEENTLDDFTFKTGSYSDICVLWGKLYTIETVSEGRAQLIAIDLQSGDEEVIHVFKGEDANNVWFNNLIGDKLYLWVNGTVFSLDKKNNIKDTGYRNPLFITENGVFLSASTADGANKGLSFVSNGSVVEYPQLTEKTVDIKFKYGSRIYMTVDNMPAYLENNGKQEVTYVNVSSGIPDLNNVLSVCLNYVGTPEKVLVLSVGSYDLEASDPGSMKYSKTYTLDVETGKATEIYEKKHLIIPICWPCVIGEEIFVGGIGDSTDWVSAFA